MSNFSQYYPPIARVQVVTPPDGDVIDMDELKRHLRVDFDDDDDEIRAYMQAAVDALEGDTGYLGRAILSQTLDAFYSYWPSAQKCWSSLGSYIQLPMPPVTEVTGVFYKDADGVEQTMDPAGYTVDLVEQPALIYSQSWPAVGDFPGSIRVRFVAGYPVNDGVSSVPYSIRSALKLMIADLYENREQTLVDSSVSELPHGVPALLRKYRTHLGFA